MEKPIKECKIFYNIMKKKSKIFQQTFFKEIKASEKLTCVTMVPLINFVGMLFTHSGL